MKFQSMQFKDKLGREDVLRDAVKKYIAGLVCVAALLFLPAGTIAYLNGWLFIGLLFIPMFFLGIVLFLKAPELLEKRLQSRETESEQKMVIGGSLLMFLAGFILSALDFRFGWTYVPDMVVAIASVILLVSYGLYAEVMRENAYLSRTVEIQQGQQVIDTGLYGIVRHPMYAVTLWLFLAIPVVLGSWWALLCFVPYLPMLAVRILNEEKLLSRELVGYADYQKRVKYRLILFIW